MNNSRQNLNEYIGTLYLAPVVRAGFILAGAEKKFRGAEIKKVILY